MTTAEMQNAFNILDLSRMVEFSLAEFYSACAECCPGTAEFWHEIARQERQHARYILRIVNLLATAPGEFTLREHVRSDAIFEFFRGVEAETRNVLFRRQDPATLPFLAADFEAAVVEKHLYDLLDSENAEYKELVQLIARESIDHRVMIQEHDWTCEIT